MSTQWVCVSATFTWVQKWLLLDRCNWRFNCASWNLLCWRWAYRLIRPIIEWLVCKSLYMLSKPMNSHFVSNSMSWSSVLCLRSTYTICLKSSHHRFIIVLVLLLDPLILLPIDYLLIRRCANLGVKWLHQHWRLPLIKQAVGHLAISLSLLYYISSANLHARVCPIWARILKHG